MKDILAPILQEETKEEAKEEVKEETITLSKKEFEELTAAIKQQTEVIKSQIGFKQVEAPIQEVYEEMSPADHVEKIFNDLNHKQTTYRDPGKIKDYEAAVWILKRKGFRNEDIADFLIE